jgi:hypothetical protein
VPANPAFDPDDYPDCRTAEQRTAERVHVETQVASLIKMATDNDEQRAVFARLDRRRRPHKNRVQLEAVRREERTDLIAAEGSVVARNADMDDRMLDRLHTEFGAHRPHAEHSVVRLDVRRDHRTPPSITDVVRRMCSAGVDAAMNYVIPLAGYIKGAGGPEPSAGTRAFPEVGISGPVVAVLDTGISAEVRTDGFLSMPVAADDVDELDEFPPDGLLDAGAGHGSFVSGIIQQVAPNADVRVHKVIDSDGLTTDVAIAQGIREAAAGGARIINMSLGTETLDDTAPLALLEAVRDLQDAGVVLVCAAGNNAGDEPVWPAALADRFDNVVAVAALGADGEPASWSSRGSWVTCSTIGEGVVSTYVIGTEDGELIDDPDPDTYGPDSWACWTGTSFAAPQVTGALVRLMTEDPQLQTPLDALRELEKRAGGSTPGYGFAVRILPGT